MRPNEKAIEMEFWVMLRIYEMQFASAADLAGLGEYSMSQCRKTLDVLERRGDASCSQLGATERKQNRYLSTSQGVQKVKDKFGESPGWYTVEPGARDLALRMPMVEQFYRILPKLRAAAGYQAAGDRGLVAANPRLYRFIWLRNDSYHAIVEFENGVWFVLIYAGVWSTAEVLRRKWDDRLKGSLDHRPWIEWGVDDEIPWEARPSAWVIVGLDHWAAQVAYQEIAPGEDAYTKMVFVDGEELYGGFMASVSADRIVESTPERDVGEPARVLRKLEDNEQEAAINGKFPFGVFRTIGEFYGATAAQVARLLRNSDDETPVLKRLVAAGLVVIIDGRFYLTERGWRRAAKIDRVYGGRAKNLLASFITEEDHTRKRYRRHDSAVIDLADRFRRHGMAVANGWRAVLNVPDVTQVAPDLVVCVGDGPFGNAWHYLEFERSATEPAAVERKLRPYIRMMDMGISLPLLVVCEQRTAEEVFWAKGRGLRMLTTTLAEARPGPLVGPTTVWLQFGRPVSLYAPTDASQKLIVPWRRR